MMKWIVSTSLRLRVAVVALTIILMVIQTILDNWPKIQIGPELTER